MALWIRICLPMQGAWVQYLVWEDSTCCGATKPLCHSYWAHALEPASCNYWPRLLQLLKPSSLEPVFGNKRSFSTVRSPHTALKSSPHSLQLEKACCCCWVAPVVSDSMWLHRRQPTRLPRPWDSPGKNTGVGCHFLLQCMKVKACTQQQRPNAAKNKNKLKKCNICKAQYNEVCLYIH